MKIKTMVATLACITLTTVTQHCWGAAAEQEKKIARKMNELWASQPRQEIDGPDIQETTHDKVYNEKRVLEAWYSTAAYYQAQGYLGHWQYFDQNTKIYYRFSAHNDSISVTNPSGLGGVFSSNDAKRIPNFSHEKFIPKDTFDKKQASYYGDLYDSVPRIVIKKGPKIIHVKEKQEFYDEACAAIKAEDHNAALIKEFLPKIIISKEKQKIYTHALAAIKPADNAAIVKAVLAETLLATGPGESEIIFPIMPSPESTPL